MAINELRRDLVITLNDYKKEAKEVNQYKRFLSPQKRQILSEINARINEFDPKINNTDAERLIINIGVLFSQLFSDDECRQARNRWFRFKFGFIIPSVLSLFIGFIIFGVKYQIPFVLNLISFIGSIPNWIAFLVYLVLGLLLFWLRSKIRIAYAIIELIFSIGLMFSVISNKGFDFTTYTNDNLLSIIGGLYVMVRGLDNLTKGLETTTYGDRWLRFFAP